LAALRGAAGRFLVSINDTPDMRQAFAWAEIAPVETRYSIAGESQVAAELLIGRGVNLAPAAAQPRLL
jgi:DNA adenine methylase